MPRAALTALAAALAACGGAPSSPPETAESAAPASEPAAQATGAAAPSEPPPPETPEQAVAGGAADPDADPDPTAPPITPGSAADIQAALQAASFDVPALHRLIDPARGLGTYDPDDTGVEHHCGRDEAADHPGVAFAVHEGDDVRCDAALRRCVARSMDGSGGYVFYFRPDAGDAVYLDAVIHYPNRMPRQDPPAARAFAEGGAGVCALRRALVEGASPDRFSVFVSSYTGLQRGVRDDQLCGAAASAAYEQEVASRLGGGPTLTCTRAPARCTFTAGDEEHTVYADAGEPVAVAITRHGMRRNLEAGQQRELARFLRRLEGHRCD
ncbi:MAG: hypothetical protein ACFCGT_00035 [Sandaracinaceae bacterium]